MSQFEQGRKRHAILPVIKANDAGADDPQPSPHRSSLPFGFICDSYINHNTASHNAVKFEARTRGGQIQAAAALGQVSGAQQ